MPEEHALIPAEVTGGLAKYSDDIFASTTKSGDYLPRLQLLTSASEKCKSGEFPINHYAVIRDQIFDDLGEAVDILVVTWRPKALEIGDEVISVFKPEHPEFKRIQDKSGEQDSGCMYGPEFLVYIPAKKVFATFFCGSKSSRREAPAIKALLTKAATLKSKKIETKRYTWFAPAVVGCSTPFETPNIEDLKKAVEKFNNPPETVIETVDETTERAR